MNVNTFQKRKLLLYEIISILKIHTHRFCFFFFNLALKVEKFNGGNI